MRVEVKQEGNKTIITIIDKATATSTIKTDRYTTTDPYVDLAQSNHMMANLVHHLEQYFLHLGRQKKAPVLYWMDKIKAYLLGRKID